jgi:hypothetical protein
MITGFVGMVSGNVRIIEAEKGFKCAPNLERTVEWNQTGPPAQWDQRERQTPLALLAQLDRLVQLVPRNDRRRHLVVASPVALRSRRGNAIHGTLDVRINAEGLPRPPSGQPRNDRRHHLVAASPVTGTRRRSSFRPPSTRNGRGRACKAACGCCRPRTS